MSGVGRTYNTLSGEKRSTCIATGYYPPGTRSDTWDHGCSRPLAKDTTMHVAQVEEAQRPKLICDLAQSIQSLLLTITEMSRVLDEAGDHIPLPESTRVNVCSHVIMEAAEKAQSKAERIETLTNDRMAGHA